LIRCSSASNNTFVSLILSRGSTGSQAKCQV